MKNERFAQVMLIVYRILFFPRASTPTNEFRDS